jgi:hypothetical protein
VLESVWAEELWYDGVRRSGTDGLLRVASGMQLRSSVQLTAKLRRGRCSRCVAVQAVDLRCRNQAYNYNGSREDALLLRADYCW